MRAATEIVASVLQQPFDDGNGYPRGDAPIQVFGCVRLVLARSVFRYAGGPIFEDVEHTTEEFVADGRAVDRMIEGLSELRREIAAQEARLAAAGIAVVEGDDDEEGGGG